MHQEAEREGLGWNPTFLFGGHAPCNLKTFPWAQPLKGPQHFLISPLWGHGPLVEHAPCSNHTVGRRFGGHSCTGVACTWRGSSGKPVSGHGLSQEGHLSELLAELESASVDLEKGKGLNGCRNQMLPGMWKERILHLASTGLAAWERKGPMLHPFLMTCTPSPAHSASQLCHHLWDGTSKDVILRCCHNKPDHWAGGEAHGPGGRAVFFGFAAGSSQVDALPTMDN
jgi:hypothetical protein